MTSPEIEECDPHPLSMDSLPQPCTASKGGRFKVEKGSHRATRRRREADLSCLLLSTDLTASP